MLKQTGLDWHRFSKEKGEDFREEEGVKVDLAMTKDCMVAVRDEATQMQGKNKLFSEQLQAERTAGEKAGQTIGELRQLNPNVTHVTNRYCGNEFAPMDDRRNEPPVSKNATRNPQLCNFRDFGFWVM